MSTSTAISVVLPLGPGGGDPPALADILHAALSPSGWSCELVAVGAPWVVAGRTEAVVDVAVPDHIVVLDAVAHAGERTSELVGPLLDDRHDFVLGSRPTDGGAGPPGGPFCRLLFRLAVLPARLLTPVRDPRSGCFACRRDRMPELRLGPRDEGSPARHAGIMQQACTRAIEGAVQAAALRADLPAQLRREPQP